MLSMRMFLHLALERQTWDNGTSQHGLLNTMNLPTLNAPYAHGQLLRHMDGGYYQYDQSVLFADDQDELVIYKHIWPFEESVWARRYSEFKDRFTPITADDLATAKAMDRQTVQDQIEQTRSARRHAKAG